MLNPSHNNGIFFYSMLIYNDKFWVLWLEIDKIHKSISLILLEFNIELDNGGYLHIFII